MSDEADSAPEAAAISYPIEGDEPMSLEDAASGLAAAREKAANPKSPAKAAEAAPADPELPDEGDVDPDADPPIDEDEVADPAEQPPIARPKSWTETEDAEWKATPRALQEKIVARELDRDNALRKSQNEAADKLKGLTAKEQAAEQARQQYEAKLPALMQALHNTNNSAFSDIKSQDDADLLAVVDPVRWVQWKSHQDRMAATNYELQQAESGKSAKELKEWGEYRASQDVLATEAIPDLADPVKGPKLMERAGKRLADLGFTNEELGALINGKQKIAVVDHRFQKLVFDSIQLAEIQSAKKAVAVKLVPPVQRPGTPKPAAASSERQVQDLMKQLDTATGSRAAQLGAEIYRLQSKSAGR